MEEVVLLDNDSFDATVSTVSSEAEGHAEEIVCVSSLIRAPMRINKITERSGIFAAMASVWLLLVPSSLY